MSIDVHAPVKPVIDLPEAIAASWLRAFDRYIPARVLAALSVADGFVVLTGEAGIEAEVASAVVSRLREAGFEIAATTAPLTDHSALSALIGEALGARPALERPLVVMVACAESLSSETAQRLVKLAGLRRDEQPILRFLLTGTPALWPMLRAAGLGGLEHDAASHVRLMPDLIRYLPVSPQPEVDHPHEPGLAQFDRATAAPVDQPQKMPSADADDVRSREPSPRSKDGWIGRGTAIAIVGLTLAGIGVAGGVATWAVLVPLPDRPKPVASAVPSRVRAPVISFDDRLSGLLDRERKEIAADHPSSRADLIQTRRQIDEILPQVSTEALTRLSARAGAAPAKPVGTLAPVAGPAASIPDDGQVKKAASPPSLEASQPAGPVGASVADPVHVTLRYSHGDNAAAAKAARIRAALHARGVAVDGPLALGQVIERSSLAYYFAQDQTVALDLAQHLLSHAPQVHKMPPPSWPSLPRPGEISISIGSGDAADISAL